MKEIIEIKKTFCGQMPPVTGWNFKYILAWYIGKKKNKWRFYVAAMKCSLGEIDKLGEWLVKKKRIVKEVDYIRLHTLHRGNILYQPTFHNRLVRTHRGHHLQKNL